MTVRLSRIFYSSSKFDTVTVEVENKSSDSESDTQLQTPGVIELPIDVIVDFQKYSHLENTTHVFVSNNLTGWLRGSL